MTLLRALALLLAVVASPLWADKQRLDVSGQLFLDADYYGAFWNREGEDDNSDAQVRRARIQFEYDFPRGWLAKLQVDGDTDFDEGDVELGSAYFRYTKWRVADITLGKMKEPLGMERNTAANRLQTIEGSMMSTAFTPDKSWGVHLFNATSSRRWALAAVVEDDEDDDYEEDPPVALTGRFTWSPINEADRTLQVGLSGSLRDWNENLFQVRDRAELGSGDRVVRSAAFLAEQQATLGLEGLWRQGGWQLQGEYMATRVEEVDGPDWDYDGYYVTGSYLYGGQRRFRKSEFRRLRPDPGGAWELVARYSYVNLRQRGLGSRASMSTLGVNYYHSADIRFMLSFLHPDISGSVWHHESSGNALSFRAQFLF